MKQKESEKAYTMRLYSTNYYRQMNNLTIFVKESGKLHLFLKLLKHKKWSAKPPFPRDESRDERGRMFKIYCK